jgi:hypothetical protein
MKQIRPGQTEDNPADLIARGMNVDNLLTSKLWWTGPDSLNQEAELWPVWSPQLPDKLDNATISHECKERPVKFETILFTTIASDNT